MGQKGQRASQWVGTPLSRPPWASLWAGCRAGGEGRAGVHGADPQTSRWSMEKRKEFTSLTLSLSLKFNTFQSTNTSNFYSSFFRFPVNQNSVCADSLQSVLVDVPGLCVFHSDLLWSPWSTCGSYRRLFHTDGQAEACRCHQPLGGPTAGAGVALLLGPA